MSDPIFKKVDYTLGGLMSDIYLGRIGLPDIQRPFVWEAAQVRDLFDSMYKGYPVGYLMLWENGSAENSRNIGVDGKQMSPSLLVVDGQQRLTSLYAVLNGVPVMGANYTSERIYIAFNPLEERFAVRDAAVRQSKGFIPDISSLWDGNASIIRLGNQYLAELKATREVSAKDEEKIQDAIVRLHSLTSFPLTALQLNSDISEEAVAEVFVRINSKGEKLTQSDFILTLMSVFWDEGRAQLEQFCRDAQRPANDGTSPFNHFIKPSPDQLLRVGVIVAFKRSRLNIVYSILQGKNLRTQEFSQELRDDQFAKLKQAQERVLHIQYWHDFLRCIHQAGFRSSKMISSSYNMLYSYALYLIGRTEYGVDEFDLRQAMAQWFFMATLTGRYTGSAESTLDSDLASLRGVSDAKAFVGRLKNVCDRVLTNNFWTKTLPGNLATSSASSPSKSAYEAALTLLEAPGLFSKSKVADALDPNLQANSSAIERHHLFPVDYLSKTLGISAPVQRNQIANYAYVEWGDDIRIGGQSPADYLPQIRQRVSSAELGRMYQYHALPKNWEQMRYQAFLEARRELMAKVIREGYQKLTGDSVADPDVEEVDIAALIASGESDAVEFKSTLRVNLHTGNTDPKMEHTVLKTLAGFLNSRGGTLIIGVADDGTPVGIERDNFPNEDAMSLHLVNIINARMEPQTMAALQIHYDDYEGSRVMVVNCRRSPKPVFLREGNRENFYVRGGPATGEFTNRQTQDYIKMWFDQ